MPRRSAADTHRRLLDAGRELLERGGPTAVTLEGVAAQAGVSRQAIYLHFGSRARFLLELLDFVGANAVFGQVTTAIQDAPTAADALRALVEIRAASSRRHHALTGAFNAARVSDAEVNALWEERQRRRLKVIGRLTRRMHREGALRSGISAADAAALIWATLSFETWQYLVQTRGWSSRRYVDRMYGLLARALLA